MKSLSISILFFLTFSSAHAACKLPANERITIGCTYRCDKFMQFRLKTVGALLGYKVKFINLSKSNKDIAQNLRLVDSVLIPGGADIHPKFYLKNVTEELRTYTENNLHLVNFTDEGRKRDLFEYTLLKIYLGGGAIFQKLPVMGICRGMQMMSVAQGIPLYLDIKTELGIPNRQYKLDKVYTTEEDSLMSSLYGGRSFRAVELHHQGIRVDYFQAHQSEYPNVKVSAYSNKGKVAESIEYTDMTALGVQYHPEKSLPHVAFPVFKWFLTKACEYKTSKDQI